MELAYECTSFCSVRHGRKVRNSCSFHSNNFFPAKQQERENSRGQIKFEKIIFTVFSLLARNRVLCEQLSFHTESLFYLLHSQTMSILFGNSQQCVQSVLKMRGQSVCTFVPVYVALKLVEALTGYLLWPQRLFVSFETGLHFLLSAITK